jgi:uncharacterized protein (TIGR02145 family)
MNKFLISPLLVLASFLMLTISCKKKADDIADINFNPSITYGSMTDQDGNVYKTVTIGNQTWMAENLKTTRYRNGDPIALVTDNTKWINLTTGAYCWYNNDLINKSTYGALYNWFAVYDNRDIAPAGWHIPNADEWNTLITYLGGETAASMKLRENGTSHWTGHNYSPSNQSGFTGLPAGFREFLDGKFFGLESYCYWWSSNTDESDTERAWILGLNYWFVENVSWNHIDNMTIQKIYGASVRCIKDN